MALGVRIRLALEDLRVTHIAQPGFAFFSPDLLGESTSWGLIFLLLARFVIDSGACLLTLAVLFVLDSPQTSSGCFLAQ